MQPRWALALVLGLVGCSVTPGPTPPAPTTFVPAPASPALARSAPHIEPYVPPGPSLQVAPQVIRGFSRPEGVAIAADGTMYVAEPYSYRLRRVAPDGTLTTLAGGQAAPGREDGTGAAARFMGPKDVAFAPGGELWVIDFDAVRRVSPQGRVVTVPLRTATGAAFQPVELFGIAAAPDGGCYLAGPSWIAKMRPDGVVTRLAGRDVRGFADGVGAQAGFDLPGKLAVDAQGTLLVPDSGNHRLRAVRPDGTVTTLAGNGMPGQRDGLAAGAGFDGPMGVEREPRGPIYLADSYNRALRVILAGGSVKTLAMPQPLVRPTDVAIAPDGARVIVDRDADCLVRLP